MPPATELNGPMVKTNQPGIAQMARDPIRCTIMVLISYCGGFLGYAPVTPRQHGLELSNSSLCWQQSQVISM